MRIPELRQRAFAAMLAFTLPVVLSAQAKCPRGALPAYAHNDYANTRPLVDALLLGFRGAEVDVFLVDGVLRVGHDRRAAKAGGALETLYLLPLRALAARCGHLTADGKPFFFALELKEKSAEAYDSLVVLLGRYRELLQPPPSASQSAPVLNVVLVGWHPDSAADTLIGWQYRIAKPGENESPTLDVRVRLISLDYGKTMGRWWVTANGRRRWLAWIGTVKAGAPDRLLRVHNVPTDVRVYEELLAAGVDLIGTKRLSQTARLLAAPSAP